MSVPIAQPNIDAETLRVYYTQQYQRMNHLEGLRVQFSSYVVAGTVVAMGVVLSDQEHSKQIVAEAAALIVAVQLAAILFMYNSRYWFKLHQARARMALQHLSPVLAALQEQSNLAYKRVDTDRWYFIRRDQVQTLIHVSLALIAVAGVLLA